MSFIVLQILQEWHDRHVEHHSGAGRVPVIRKKGEVILDPEEVAHALKHRPAFVQKRAATADEADAIEAMMAARKPPEAEGAEHDAEHHEAHEGV